MIGMEQDVSYNISVCSATYMGKYVLAPEWGEKEEKG